MLDLLLKLKLNMKKILKTLENVETDHVFKKTELTDGNVIYADMFIGPEAPAKCPVCLNPKAFFEIKETNY